MTTTFPEPTEAAFLDLARTDPARLLAWIASGTLRDTALTFAAEHAGEIADADAVIPALLPLLAHEKSYVREGAVYGLWRHIADRRAFDALDRLAVSDPSPALRGLAYECVHEHEKSR